MTLTRPALLCASLLAVTASTAPARAASPADQAAAEVLFTEARKLAAAGDFEHACPKFAESQRLDPSAGGALSVGDCFEKLGKLASAWGAFKDAEIIARNGNDLARQAEGARRAERLSMKLSKLAILVPPAVRVPGFELRRDGAVVGEGQWGSALPVDAGQHTIEATAPGRKPWSTWVRIDVDGSSVSVDVPPLEPVGAPAQGAAPGLYWSTQRTAGVVVGSIGAAGVIAGAVLGGLTIAKKNAMTDHCLKSDPHKCDAEGVDLRAQGIALANGSNVAFAVGGTALVTGLVLFFTAPSVKPAEPAANIRVTPLVTGEIRGISFIGRW